MAIIKTYPLKNNYYGPDRLILSDMQPDSLGVVHGTTKSLTLSNLKSFIGTGSDAFTLTTTGTSGAATFNTNTKILNIPDYSVGNVDGSGTAGKIPKWQDSNTLEDSEIFQSGTNVGIGTTSPSQKLTVSGKGLFETGGSTPDSTIATYEKGITLTSGGAGNQRLVIDVSDVTNGGSYIQTRHQSTGFPDAEYALALNPLGGNVGIGTTSPTEKLEVAGNIKTTGGFISTVSSGYSSMELGGPSGAYIDLKGPSTDDYDLRIISGGSGGSFWTGGFGHVMTLNASGNVGIGTTSPSTKLDVVGNIKTSGKVYINGTANFIDTTRNASSQANYMRFYDSSTSSVEAYVGFTSNNRDFKINSANGNGTLTLQAGGGTAIYVDSSQKVGIGTTAPNAKLHIQDTSGSISTIRMSAASSNANYAFIKMEDVTANTSKLTLGATIGYAVEKPAIEIFNSYTTLLGDGTSNGRLLFNCSANTHSVAIIGPDHSGGSSYSLKLPNSLPSVSNQILESNGAGALSWIPTPTGGGGSGGTVTSVGLSMPTAFSVSNSPITGNGSISVGVTGGNAGEFLDYLGNWSTPTNTTYSGSQGILLTGTNFTNTDKGSSQSIFKNIAVSGQNTATASQNNATLELIAGTNVTITTNTSNVNKTITINSAGSGGGGIAFSGSTADGIATFGSTSTADVSSKVTLSATGLIDLDADGQSAASIDFDPTGTRLKIGDFNSYGGIVELFTDGSRAFQVGVNGELGLGTGASQGTSGQVLTSGGSGAPPTWSSSGAGGGSSGTSGMVQLADGSSGFTNSASLVWEIVSGLKGKLVIGKNTGSIYDREGILRLQGGPNSAGTSGVGGTIELQAAVGKSGGAPAITKIKAPTSNSSAQDILLPSALPTANTQVLGIDTIVGTQVTTQWATPYSVMGAGNGYAAGLVLAGNATHGGYFLRRDGVWGTPPITTLTAGTGITINSGNEIINTDAGSSQFIYKNFTASSGGTATASSNNDNLTIAAGSGITTTRSGDTITVAATGSGSYEDGFVPLDIYASTGQVGDLSGGYSYMRQTLTTNSAVINRIDFFVTSVAQNSEITFALFDSANLKNSLGTCRAVASSSTLTAGLINTMSFTDGEGTALDYTCVPGKQLVLFFAFKNMQIAGNAALANANIGIEQDSIVVGPVVNDTLSDTKDLFLDGTANQKIIACHFYKA